MKSYYIKKIIFLTTFSLSSFLTVAQNKNGITVIGKATHVDSDLMYVSTVSLSKAYTSYSDGAISLAQMKTRYDEALKKNGLSLNNMREDKIAYDLSGYADEGTFFTFKTRSIEQFQKFMRTTTFGLNRLSYEGKFILDQSELEILNRKALANAKMQAEAIARAMNIKLGKVLSVEAFNAATENAIIVSLFQGNTSGAYTYQLKVIYAVKE
ncbi:DUF541 domain-containing protein [Flavobacteriaceae bacterium R38]|nr:DUF541 domain-containing protein [Flavobacteriaceae bacterium R38]